MTQTDRAFAADNLVSSNKRSLVAVSPLGILGIALTLRLIAFLDTPVAVPLRVDALQYYSAAHNLRYHGVYSTFAAPLLSDAAVAPRPDAARSPGYPLLLAALMGPVPTQSVLDVSL